MAELTLRPDPALWAMVPGVEDADAWLHERLDHLPAERKGRSLDAAVLALRARVETEASAVLLLDAGDGAVLSCLTVLGYDDVPPATSAEQAERVARALVASSWEASVIEVGLGAVAGWRVTILDDAASATEPSEPVTVASAVWTVYVLDVAGRAVVAFLSPLRPDAGFVAQVHAERVLATLEVEAT